jgi:hypothetical protein
VFIKYLVKLRFLREKNMKVNVQRQADPLQQSSDIHVKQLQSAEAAQKIDTRANQALQRQHQEDANNCPRSSQLIQYAKSMQGIAPVTQFSESSKNAGLPRLVKSGPESFSDMGVNRVKVHHQSDKPVQLKAAAYSQSRQPYLAPEQEQHLQQEVRHVVPQAQRRLKPAAQLMFTKSSNLEREADVMEDRPTQIPHKSREAAVQRASIARTVQTKFDSTKLNSNWQAPISGNSSADAPLQAKVKIGSVIFPDHETRREFNRTLMLELKANQFKELGTKAMWKYVGGLVDHKKLGDERKFDNWKAFIEQMWEKGYLERVQRGTSMGPKNMGARPTFTTETQEAISLKGGEHRRHIISSSSLGKGIETAYGLLKAQNTGDNVGKTLELLNAWNSANGGENCDSEYSALRMMWRTVHNHNGNLFPGEGAANSAIGFIRSPLSALLEDLKKKKNDMIKIDDIVKTVKDIKPTMAWLKDRWVEITTTLADTLTQVDPVISSFGLDAAYINISQQFPLDDSGVHGIYRKLEAAFGVNAMMRSTNLIADLETELQDKKYQFLKPELRQGWRTQIERFSYGRDTISGEKAHELVEEWICNCDLDYPVGQIESESRGEYNQALVTIYHQVMNPGATLFSLDGPLADFMKLDFRK